jgi:DNA-dependent RNA polymerase auxiliary subunit epsilon
MKTKSKKRISKLIQIDGKSVPDFEKLVKENPNYNILFIEALNYASVVFELSDKKTFATDYAKTVLNVNVSNIPDYEFLSVGSICWLISSGAYVEQKTILEYNKKLLDLVLKYEKKDAQTKTKKSNVITLTPAAVKTNELIGELEGLLDDVYTKKSNIVQPYDLIKSFGQLVKLDVVEKWFSTQLADINDPEAAEGYENLSTFAKKAAIGALTIILKDIQKIKAEDQASAPEKKAKTKKLSKPKKIVPSKMVRKLNYLKSFDELGLKSVQPEKIVGSTTVWVYNIKTRKLGKYVALDGSPTGILVKGSTLMNFDTVASVSKKLRKPKETIAKLLTAGKVEQRKLLDDINAKPSVLNGRINKDCVIVKVS